MRVVLICAAVKPLPSSRSGGYGREMDMHLSDTESVVRTEIRDEIQVPTSEAEFKLGVLE